MTQRHILTTVLCAAAMMLAASSSQAKKLKVTATTGMVADTVQNVGGDRVEVVCLMGPGVDPHLYKASQGDIARLTRADVIFYNGLHLEGKMAELMDKLARKGTKVFVVAEAIDPKTLMKPEAYEGSYDPHIWFDVELWSETIPVIVKGLTAADPSGKETYEKNGKAYHKKLMALHDETVEKIASIPERQRVLITAHDAFGYFGRAYKIEVMGLQGISTADEYGLRDVKRMVDFIVERKIKAVFVESSVPPRSIEAVVAGVKAQNHEVKVGGELFSDAMGDADTPEGTYLGMVRHNVDTIVSSLR